MSNSPTIVQWHPHAVSRSRGCVVWFTGLSGSGKSTIANAVDLQLQELGVPAYVLDGDNLRHGLNAAPERLQPRYGEAFARRFGLGFAPDDRTENIRRIGCVAELFCSAGLIALAAFVSPYRKDREAARQLVTLDGQHPRDFVEVFVDTPLAECEQRDPKGLYRKARAGELKGMTGIDDPYEAPTQPELVLAAGSTPVLALAQQVLDHLTAIGKLQR